MTPVGTRNRTLVALLLLALVGGAFLAGYGYGTGRSAAGGSADSEGFALLRNVLQQIRTTYIQRQVPTDQLFYGAARGMLDALGDPYSRFMDPAGYREFREKEFSGVFTGVGIFVELEEGWPTVLQPIPGTPAARAGLRPGDRITAVDGRSTEKLSLEEVVSRIRGPAGTTVRLRLQRGGRTFEVSLVRARIRHVTVQDDQFLDADQRSRLQRAGAGYLRIIQFDQPTAGDFRKALDRELASGVRGIILDLRGNPGGLLDVAVAVADAFVSAGQPIVITVDRDGRRDVERAAGGRKVTVPVVVLVNEYSASAAEIVAGALRDHDIAPLVGMRTFGKGVIQRIITLPGGSGATLTSGRYLTPDGYDIHKKGLTPTVAVGNRLEGRSDTEMRRIEAEQFARAVDLLRQRIARGK